MVQKLLTLPRTCCGVDPGTKGGVGIAREDGSMEAWTLAEMTPHEIWNIINLCRMETNLAILERVGAMPKQGVSSTAKFMRNAGWCEMALIGNDYKFERVGPSKWQGVMRCRTGGKKAISRRKAQELFPHAVCHTKSGRITDDVADCLLIAAYGRMTHR